MVLLAITTVFRTVLILIGVFVLLRVIGQFMVAKRNLQEEKELLEKQRKSEKEAAEAQKNFGKTTVGKIDKSAINDSDYTDFEEVK
jgi:hypothetical protein